MGKRHLQTRYDELEELNDAINDRCPFDGFFLKWVEEDDEEEVYSLTKCTASFVLLDLLPDFGARMYSHIWVSDHQKAWTTWLETI